MVTQHEAYGGFSHVSSPRCPIASLNSSSMCIHTKERLSTRFERKPWKISTHTHSHLSLSLSLSTFKPSNPYDEIFLGNLKWEHFLISAWLRREKGWGRKKFSYSSQTFSRYFDKTFWLSIVAIGWLLILACLLVRKACGFKRKRSKNCNLTLSNAHTTVCAQQRQGSSPPPPSHAMCERNFGQLSKVLLTLHTYT